MIWLFLIGESLSREECQRFKWWGRGEGKLQIYVKMRIFLIWLIFWYFIIESLYSTVQLSPGHPVCHIDKKMSVVSFPWCTLGSLVYYFSILYFSCVPGGDWERERERNLQQTKSPLIFHRSLNMTVLHCASIKRIDLRQTMTNQHLFVPFDIFRILLNKITS